MINKLKGLLLAVKSQSKIEDIWHRCSIELEICFLIIRLQILRGTIACDDYDPDMYSKKEFRNLRREVRLLNKEMKRRNTKGK